MVILHADPSRGGAERYTADLAQGLRGRGHEVYVLASSFAGEVVPPGGVLLAAAGATRAGRYARFLDSLGVHLATTAYDRVHAMLPVRRCDLYHPHAGIAAEEVTSGHLKYDGPIRRAMARAGQSFNRRRQKFAAVERTLLAGEHPPTVLCLSEYVKRFVRKHYTLPEAKLATLFNAVDLAKFDPSLRPNAGRKLREEFRIDDNRVLGLMIAQDFVRKGLREAIEAIARAGNPRVMLLVAGRPDPAPYRELAAQLRLSDRVIFSGETTDPYAFYQAADFFLLPTRHDPCSLVVLEALAMSLPVISTVLNGACEIMKDGIHGFVLDDPADVEGMAARINQMTDPAARASMRQACLLLRPALSYAHHLDTLLGIYESFAAGCSDPGA